MVLIKSKKGVCFDQCWCFVNRQ